MQRDFSEYCQFYYTDSKSKSQENKKFISRSNILVISSFPSSSLFLRIDSQGSTSESFNMRSFLILNALLPLILACDNPDSDACASAFTASSAAAASFCQTYTTAKSTATSGLPAFVSSYCSTKTAKASSACSCLVTGAATATTATTTATTLKTTTTSTTAVSFPLQGESFTLRSMGRNLKSIINLTPKLLQLFKLLSLNVLLS